MELPYRTILNPVWQFFFVLGLQVFIIELNVKPKKRIKTHKKKDT